MKKYINYFRNNLLIDLVILGAAFVFGFAVTMIFFGKAADENLLPLGTMIAFGAMIMTMIFSGIFLFPQQFNVAIAMGCTRKKFMAAYIGCSVLFHAGEMLLLFLMAEFERHVYPLLFPSKEMGKDVMQIFHLEIVLIIIVTAVVIKYFTGMIVLRYGRIGFFVLWGIYMVACLAVSRLAVIMDDNPDSAVGKLLRTVGDQLQRIDKAGAVLIFVLIMVILFAIAARMQLKQEVKNS